MAARLDGEKSSYYSFDLICRTMNPWFPKRTGRADLETLHYMCTPYLQGNYSGAEAMLREALPGSDERVDELDVGRTLGVLAEALQNQVGHRKGFQASHHTR